MSDPIDARWMPPPDCATKGQIGRILVCSAAVIVMTLGLATTPAEAAVSRTNRVSYTNTRHQSNGDSTAGPISGDGR